jgi:tetratricopeptide (TPR) repeat protein
MNARLSTALLVAVAFVLGAPLAARGEGERAPAPSAAAAVSAPAGEHSGAAGGPGAGAAPDELFARANAAFAAGRYDEAIAGFHAIVARAGYSPALLFDLGNAYFRAGKLGEAILWYERARLLAPGDPDVQANLRQARRAANLPVASGDAWLRFAEGAGANLLAILASASLFLAAIVAVAARFGRSALRERVGLRRVLASAVGGALAIAFGAGALCLVRLREVERAVVLAPGTALLVAPYEEATVSAPLDPGEVVRIDQEHQAFVLARTAKGRSGWVARSAVGTILPSETTPDDR